MKLSSEGFGRRLAAVRQDRGLTQAEIAVAIGVSRQKINSWENGSTKWVDIRDVHRCAHALRCRVKDLAAPAGNPLPSLDRSLWAKNRRRMKRLAEKGPRPQRGGRPRILSVSATNERRAVFRILLGAIRSTLAPDAVAAVVRKMSTEHGPVLVNVVLDAVELRLDKERKTFEAMRALLPVPPTDAASVQIKTLAFEREPAGVFVEGGC